MYKTNYAHCGLAGSYLKGFRRPVINATGYETLTCFWRHERQSDEASAEVENSERKKQRVGAANGQRDREGGGEGGEEGGTEVGGGGGRDCRT